MERKEPTHEPPQGAGAKETGAEPAPAAGSRFEEQARHRQKRKTMFRWALGVAIALHLAFLAWNIPALVADDPPPEKEEERAVFKIQEMKIQPPEPKPEPKPPEPEPEPKEAPKKPAPTPKPEAKKVPAPDPTPQEPEPAPEPEPTIPTPEREVDLVEETAEPILDTPEPTVPDVEPVAVEIPEPPPEPEPQGPIHVGGDVNAPVQVSGSQPEYTPAAREARVEGTVVVQAVVNKQGNVEEVKVLKDLPMGLSDRAAAAIRDWRFEPATLNGRPVDVYYNLTVNFTLD